MNSSIKLILKEYLPQRKYGEFKNNLLQRTISQTFKIRIIEVAHIDAKHYLVKGSAGQGNWARVPWLGVFDRDVSTSAQRGFDIVYLFAEDMSGVYLSLNQGWTFYKNSYGRAALPQIKKISKYLREKLRSDFSNFGESIIDLKATDSLGKGYEAGNIIAKYYPKENIPADAVLADDLRQLMGIFKELKNFIPAPNEDLKMWIDNCNLLIDSEMEQDDELFQLETQKMLPEQFKDIPVLLPASPTSSTRTTYKRNPQKSQNALKNANYQCELDSRHKTFISNSTGHPYVEAHHLIPMREQPHYKVSLDVEANIVALCPNCHRKIHLGNIEDIRNMKEYIFNTRKTRLDKTGIMEISVTTGCYAGN